MAQLTNALSSRTAQIRQEIDRTRRDMDRKLDVIQSRLAPRALAAEAWTKARRSSSAGLSQAWGKVREHPLPSAMIVAAVGWLIYEWRGGTRDDLLTATRSAARDALEEGRRMVDQAVHAARGEVQRSATRDRLVDDASKSC
jgi:ElaB/YqjD/DUF883 family membrane-anchored ribosome-binding protein